MASARQVINEGLPLRMAANLPNTARRAVFATSMSVSTPAVPVALSYRPALNYVRAVAVWLVVLAHWTLVRVPVGEIGRTTFFVLSGYLISGIIWKYEVRLGLTARRWRRLGIFYCRRALRILPPYFLALALSALLPLATIREHPGWFVLPVSNVLFYRLQHWGEGLGHFWTLAVDEQFYLVWPVILSLLPRRAGPLLLLALVGPLFRAAWTWWAGPGFVLVLLPSSFDLLAAGALLRHTEHWPSLQRLARARWVLLAWTIWVVCYPLVHQLPNGETWWVIFFPMLEATGGLLTISWAMRRWPATSQLGVLGRVGQWVGQRSYGCYLYHLLLPVVYQRAVYHLLPATVPNFVALRQFWVSPLPTVLLLTPILFLLTAASWAWVEAPLERLKARLPYGKAT